MKIIIYFFSLVIGTSLAQDSLYLVNTLVGETQNRLNNAKAAGDINGDGYNDLAVSFEDSTYIYYGNPEFELEPDYSYKGGFFLCPGDVNDDGYTDYILSGGSNCLKLYYGGTKIDTTGFIIYEVQYTAEVFSDQVDPLGDVNDDGYNDFVISSPYNWSNGISYVYLFLGGDSISSEPSVTFMHSPWIDENSEGTFGHAVTGIGDIDHDGYDDFLISDPGYADTVGAVSSGRVYLYYGAGEINSSADSILTFPDREFGFNLKNVGDINNDGSKDFAITSYDSCVIYLNFDSIMTTRFYGSGHGIGGNGDINNDSISDFILGYRKGIVEDYSGMECYLGNHEVDLIPDFYADEEQEYSSYAKYTDFIGDFNGDGYDDIFVVATTFREEDKEIGKLYLYSIKKISGIQEPKSNFINKFHLYPNYPNPFNGLTTLQFYLNASLDIKIDIYDIRGRMIKNIFTGRQSAGMNKIVWDGKTNSGKDASSGVYFVRLTEPNNRINTLNRKIILLK